MKRLPVLLVALYVLTLFSCDEVTDFFAPQAAGKSPMFLLAMGHAAARRAG